MGGLPRDWRAALLVLAGAAIPLAVATGGAHGPSAEPAAVLVRPVPVETAGLRVVEIEGVRFLPDSLTIRAGDVVEWKNGSTLAHTVTADPGRAADPERVRLPAGAKTFDSGTLRPGEVYRRTFDIPGTYAYVCIPHEAAGMVGTILVRPAETPSARRSR